MVINLHQPEASKFAKALCSYKPHREVVVFLSLGSFQSILILHANHRSDDGIGIKLFIIIIHPINNSLVCFLLSYYYL